MNQTLATWKVSLVLLGLGMGFTAALPADAANIQIGDFNKQTWSYAIDFGSPGLQIGSDQSPDNYLYDGLNGEERLRVSPNEESILFKFQEKVDDAWTLVGRRLKGLSFANIGAGESFIKLFDIDNNEVDKIFIPAGNPVLDFDALASERNQDYEVARFRVHLEADEAITGIEFVPEPLTVLGSAAALAMGVAYKRKLHKA